MIGIVLAGFWFYPLPLAKWLYLALLTAASIRHLMHLQEEQKLVAKRVQYLIALASASIGALILWQMIIGYLPVEEKHSELSSPFAKDAKYCVMSGGSSLVHNFHYRLGSNPASRYEMHAIDFTKINTLGIRTKKFSLFDPQPRDPEEYLIFDANVVAPCAGDIVELESNKPDHAAGDKFRDNTGANYITLQCNEALITLAHLREGSVQVEVGQQVLPGQILGRIGNSGNSEEPHLHIHANSIADEEGLSSPIPIRFNGRYLSRGKCL